MDDILCSWVGSSCRSLQPITVVDAPTYLLVTDKIPQQQTKKIYFPVSLDVHTRIIIERALSSERKSNCNGSRQIHYKGEFLRNEYCKMSELVTFL